MAATIGLELFGDDRAQLFRNLSQIHRPPSPWIARISGRDKRFNYTREFLRGKKDYTEANSVGSRGVKRWYILEEGLYYEVSEQCSWRRWKRYFCTVANGKIVEISKKDVETWLSTRSE